MIHGTHSGIRAGRIDELYVQCRDWKYGWIRPLLVLQGGFRSSGRDQVGDMVLAGLSLLFFVFYPYP